MIRLTELLEATDRCFVYWCICLIDMMIIKNLMCILWFITWHGPGIMMGILFHVFCWQIMTINPWCGIRCDHDTPHPETTPRFDETVGFLSGEDPLPWSRNRSKPPTTWNSTLWEDEITAPKNLRIYSYTPGNPENHFANFTIFRFKLLIFMGVLLLMEEIRRSPVEVGSLCHYLQGFIHPIGGWPWDFWTINSRTLYRTSTLRGQLSLPASCFAGQWYFVILACLMGGPVALKMDVEPVCFWGTFFRTDNMIASMKHESIEWNIPPMSYAFLQMWIHFLDRNST